ncbi:DUF4406 domain-containing protein [Faecalibaculum rodentium]|jgi:hypothetical protein|uniref:DUF4406 domain-containing protein n=1 Tax=Faecalibaculum rodentium TaxID=1702221 RepID=UPI00256ED637|nr:DUF4406 domain-containing protein [Faecalibaculum rodentium]
MKKAMISQPMGGLTKTELLEIRDKAKVALEEQGYEVLDTVFESFDSCDLCDPEHIALLHLGKNLEAMALCDAVYFCDGWQDKRGCRLEHQAASAYGIKALYEKA